MSHTVEGDRVFCYQCENEWNRSEGGLQCPRCHSEFVEILSSGQRPDVEDPPEVIPRMPPGAFNNPPQPIHDLAHHNPWGVPDPDEEDIGNFRFNNNMGQGGMGNMAFQAQGGNSFTSSRTFTFNNGRVSVTTSSSSGPMRGGGGQNDMAAQDIMMNLQGMLGNFMGGPQRGQPGLMFGGVQPGSRGFVAGPNMGGPHGEYGRHELLDDIDADPRSLLSMVFGGGNGQGGLLHNLLNPANARSGDAVFTNEAFDRVMSQLMAQNPSPGAPPAPQDAIQNLPRKKVDEAMLGDEGRAECSICMESAELGREVAVLPCSHWFDFDCIEAWLKEHGTCPQCRKPIIEQSQPQDTSASPNRRRRTSRRSSSIASPISHSTPDSPSGLREARARYYGSGQNGENGRPSSSRRASRRSDDGSGGNGGQQGEGGGVGGWIRSRLPSLGS